MPLRADFAKVWFGENFNDTNRDSKRDFTIEGTPSGDAYLLIQIKQISSPGSCQVRINREVLKPKIPAAAGGGHRLAMMDIKGGVLRPGSNEMEIERTSDDDDFTVRNVVVHWREEV